jgi:ribonuclease G
LPEWLIERGIGENRAALVEDGGIVEARIELENALPAGSVTKARLLNIGINGRNAVAIAEGGIEYLLPRGAAGATQGATLSIEVTREAIPGSEPWKRPLARTTGKPNQVAPWVAGREVPFPSPADELAMSGWDDLVDEARTGIVAFAGGQLRISATPAMTLIDVDGYLAPDELAKLGAAEAAKAIRRLDIGGSIGIDLPTVAGKSDRQSVGEAIDTILPKPFERTAMNGFGFVQIVRPRTRASLIELAQDRAAFEARALLRRAAFEPAGPRRLVAHPAVFAILEHRPDWLGSLGQQIGGSVSLRADAGLPMSGGYAEKA